MDEHIPQKLPPQNLDAEQSVLGGVLIENSALNRVLEILTDEDFAAYESLSADRKRRQSRSETVTPEESS